MQLNQTKILACLLLLSGCTSIRTEQSESDGKTTKTTTLSITSFFDSSAKVSKLRLTGTDKSQGVGLGEASTESSGSNVVGIAESITRGATKGALEYLAPKP